MCIPVANRDLLLWFGSNFVVPVVIADVVVAVVVAVVDGDIVVDLVVVPFVFTCHIKTL